MENLLNEIENSLKYRVGKNNEGIMLFISEEELKELASLGYSSRSQYTNQQWAKIRKLIKKYKQSLES